MKGVLKEIAAGLRATPVVVESATFGGELIFRLLDDKDAPGTFDAMCESMFAELDADESGALSKQELRPLIAGIGAEMGVPPEQPESAALFEAIFETADFDMSKQIEVSIVPGEQACPADPAPTPERPHTLTRSIRPICRCPSSRSSCDPSCRRWRKTCAMPP
jgi:hypothetical protein